MASCRRARKRVQVQELQAEVAIQEYANVILTQKLAERDAQIQGLLSNRASQHEGGIPGLGPESSRLVHNTIATDCICNSLYATNKECRCSQTMDLKNPAQYISSSLSMSGEHICIHATKTHGKSRNRMILLVEKKKKRLRC